MVPNHFGPLQRFKDSKFRTSNLKFKVSKLKSQRSQRSQGLRSQISNLKSQLLKYQVSNPNEEDQNNDAYAALVGHGGGAAMLPVGAGRDTDDEWGDGEIGPR